MLAERAFVRRSLCGLPWAAAPELSSLARGRPGTCIKRRTDVVQVFRIDDALLRLVAAVLVELHDEWIAYPRRDLPQGSMDRLYPAELPPKKP